MRAMGKGMDGGMDGWEHTGTILFNDTAYGGCFNAVDDVTAGARHEMTVAENLHIVLREINSQHWRCEGHV